MIGVGSGYCICFYIRTYLLNWKNTQKYIRKERNTRSFVENLHMKTKIFKAMLLVISSVFVRTVILTLETRIDPQNYRLWTTCSMTVRRRRSLSAFSSLTVSAADLLLLPFFTLFGVCVSIIC